MKLEDLVKKLKAAEKEMEGLVEKRRKLRETISAYNMILEMTDSGKLDIFDKNATGKTVRP